ncbi:MAG: septum formation inhibitor Maf [Clostridia bacterium]|nr:septum formation inhibitor Maf [Clostridia bacterium]MBQ6859223.1 septum formation inhibitor Maf [Clostridia bacterium]MBQ7052809.1 septum formation inhibitor Maf [Clostridia bacterium]
MIDLKLPLVLASGSPRRKELLELMGIQYTVDVSDVDESFAGSPENMVLELSARKAASVAARHPDALVLAADTLVFGDEVLGKPGTPERAREMLRALSGKWHSVYTGLTLMDTQSGREIRRADMTRVHFVELSDAEIERYVAGKEPLDKAGAYGIQGQGGMFIDRIDGSYSNVVGLPMAMLRDMLMEIQA